MDPLYTTHMDYTHQYLMRLQLHTECNTGIAHNSSNTTPTCSTSLPLWSNGAWTSLMVNTEWLRLLSWFNWVWATRRLFWPRHSTSKASSVLLTSTSTAPLTYMFREASSRRVREVKGLDMERQNKVLIKYYHITRMWMFYFFHHFYSSWFFLFVFFCSCINSCCFLFVSCCCFFWEGRGGFAILSVPSSITQQPLQDRTLALSFLPQ